MKTKFKSINLVLSITILLLTIFPLFSDSIEDLQKKAEERQTNLIAKDKKHQEAILAKFAEYVNKMKSKFPQLEIERIPIDPAYVDKIQEHSMVPDKVKGKSMTAYLLESYFVRSEPNPKSTELVSKAGRGEKVEVLNIIEPSGEDKKNFYRWCFVKLKNGKRGFIPSDLLSNSLPDKKSKDQKPLSYHVIEKRKFHFGIEYYGALLFSMELEEDDTLYVNTESLRVRLTPGLDGEEVGRVGRGEAVKIIKVEKGEDTINGITSKWVQVNVNGTPGWIFGGYLSKKPNEQEPRKEVVRPEQEDPEDLKKGSSFYVRVASLRLRDEPTEHGTVITTYSADTKVNIKDVKNEIENIGGIRSKWVYVLGDDFEGWVYGGFISRKKGVVIDSDDIASFFQLPLDNDIYVTSDYGLRTHPVSGVPNSNHQGIDLAGSEGTPIRAVADGKIYTVEDRGKVWLGRVTVIQHKNNVFSYYGHQSKQISKSGDKIKAGEILGEVGNTGNSKGNHLHFEVREGTSSSIEGNKVLNPHDFVKIPPK